MTVPVRFALLVAALAAWTANAALAADMSKVLRVSSPDITSLDPQQGTDLYSTRIASHIFEGLYQFDYLATPAKVIPNTAEALPQISADGRAWTIKVKRGIRFADDPVFKGKPRELVAEDYAYSIKRSLDPNLRNGGNPARKGIAHHRFAAPTLTYTYFNMEDPTVGGYTREQIALRRAIAMGFNTEEMIRVLFNGHARPATQLLPPGVQGHDTSIPVKSLYDPEGAKALLDSFGFKDRDGDGYRESPDGRPIALVRGTLPESWYREADTLWKKNMDAIGLRMNVQQQSFAELLNLSKAGKLTMFNLGLRALEPSGYLVLQTLWSKSPHDTNRARFRNTEYDKAYEEFLRTPAGPQRVRLARRMAEIVQAYVPMTLHTNGIGNVLVSPWVLGYQPSQFAQSWKYLDLDVAKRNAVGK